MSDVWVSVYILLMLLTLSVFVPIQRFAFRHRLVRNVCTCGCSDEHLPYCLSNLRSLQILCVNLRWFFKKFLFHKCNHLLTTCRSLSWSLSDSISLTDSSAFSRATTFSRAKQCGVCTYGTVILEVCTTTLKILQEL